MVVEDGQAREGNLRKTAPQVEPSHYFRKQYDEKRRFISYWHQLDEVISLSPRSVLEVGIGNSLVANYLKQRGIRVTTLDIDKRLRPDCVGSLLAMPFADGSFEVAACYEVLEHLPYENFREALQEICRVTQRYVILSLPDCTRAYRVNIQIPKVGELKRLVRLPRLRVPEHRFDGEHYWEIGKAGYPLGKVSSAMEAAGFDIVKTYRVFEMPYHRFFVLSKRRG